MQTVTVVMIDLFSTTQEEVVRTIDISNICVVDSSANLDWECNVIATKEKQAKLLEQWIRDRANEQHNTLLELKSWTINKAA